MWRSASERNSLCFFYDKQGVHLNTASGRHLMRRRYREVLHNSRAFTAVDHMREIGPASPDWQQVTVLTSSPDVQGSRCPVNGSPFRPSTKAILDLGVFTKGSLNFIPVSTFDFTASRSSTLQCLMILTLDSGQQLTAVKYIQQCYIYSAGTRSRSGASRTHTNRSSLPVPLCRDLMLRGST